MSWEQLLSIAKEAAEYAREDRDNPPVACPNDGEPLVEGPDGRLFCRWDGWKPPS